MEADAEETRRAEKGRVKMPNRPPISPETIAEIKRLRALGSSIVQIADKLSIAKHVAAYHSKGVECPVNHREIALRKFRNPSGEGYRPDDAMMQKGRESGRLKSRLVPRVKAPITLPKMSWDKEPTS
jgi:hypothetical protein